MCLRVLIRKVRDTGNLARTHVNRITIFNSILIIILFSVSLVTAPLTESSIIHSSGTIGVIATRPLHVDGKYLKDDLGNIIYLRGAGYFRFAFDPTGSWAPQGGAWSDGFYKWDETAVRYHMRTLRSWGMNSIRFHTTVDWWIDDQVTLNAFTGSYRYNLKRTIEIAAEEGVYVLFDAYTVMNGDWWLATGRNSPDGPFPPMFRTFYGYTDKYISDKQAWVNYWASVASELKVYDNVILELWNEPHDIYGEEQGYTREQVRKEWFDAVGKAIAAIRQTGAQNLILVTWSGATVPHIPWNVWGGACDMGWVGGIDTGYTQPYYQILEAQDPFTNPYGYKNIFYTGHFYRTFYNPIWHDSFNYDDAYTKMVDTKFKEIVDTIGRPAMIGEIGVNMWEPTTDNDGNGITELDEELMWATNVFNISNQWGLGYNAWSWEAVDQWHLMAQQGTMIPPPSAWGQVLVDAVAAGG